MAQQALIPVPGVIPFDDLFRGKIVEQKRDDCALVAYLTVVAIGLSEKYPDDFRDTFLKKNLPALQKEYKKSKEKCISQRDYLRE
ncbi:hypothetical protein QR680_014176 [Steinernema hermaphroditum]|uniref:Uncharacterized protein n=1 Tax=Steinernema hermaphroditum TaxID=289476 RepID=A0AA39M3R9_9BILA|nr:hypothetical protein QR680_014176 [Steinernema hermaphroditum]